jgi:hypothetical protein
MKAMRKKFVKISLAVLAFATTPAAFAATPTKPPIMSVMLSPEQAAANKMAMNIIPDGTYARIMNDMMGNMDSMMDQVFGLVGGFMGGDAKGKTGAEIRANMEADMAKRDPNYKERMNITMKVMGEEMGKLFTKVEPMVRDGLGKSFARQYSLIELNEMNGFFATPTGAKLGRNFMGMFTDKDLMDSMFKMVPDVIKEMPGIMTRVEKATAHLAKPKSEADVAVGDTAAAAGEEANAAGAAAFAAGDAAAAGFVGTEPWYDRENWTKADVKRVEALETKYLASSAKSADEYEDYDAAINEVTEKVHQQYLAKGWKPAPAALPTIDEYPYLVAKTYCMRDGDNSDCEDYDLEIYKKATDLRSKWSAGDAEAVAKYESESDRQQVIAEKAQTIYARALEMEVAAQRQAGANAGQMSGMDKGSIATAAENAGKAFDEAGSAVNRAGSAAAAEAAAAAVKK